MKKIILYTSAFTLLMFTLSSCNSEMDITPDGRLTIEEVFSNPEYVR